MKCFFAVRELVPILLSILLTASLTVAPAAAQDWSGRGRVQGAVSDEAGNPLEGATVTLRRPGTDAGPDPFTTNKKGRWSYLGLGSGPWEVTITLPGYADSQGTFPVSEFGGNDPIHVTLQSAAAAAAEASGISDAEAEAQAAAEAAATAALSQASDLLDQQKYAEARTLLEEAMTNLEQAKHPEIYLTIAKSYVNEGNSDAAVAALEQGLAIDPQHADSLQLISSVLVNEGRQEEAEQYMARLPEGKKIDPNALLNQAIQKYNNNDLDAALADFDRIVTDYPDNADAYYYRGLTYLGKASNAEAIADFEKMLEIAPDHANAGEAKQFLEYLRSQ